MGTYDKSIFLGYNNKSTVVYLFLKLNIPELNYTY